MAFSNIQLILENMAYSTTISIMLKAARKAARGLIRDFGEVENLQVSRKGTADFVSSADLRAEQILINELQAARPAYGLLLEEKGEIPGSDKNYRFIVDPLDGTTNFLHGIPYFCISIALEKLLPSGKKEIIAAVIDAPALRETFIAEKGGGSWVERGGDTLVGQSRLRVAARKSMTEALIMNGGFEAEEGVYRQKLFSWINRGAIVRSFGSSALGLAYVAAGRGDIYLQSGECPWDIAAGILLIKEAGGLVTDGEGGDAMIETGAVIASNLTLHKSILSLVNPKT